MQNIAICFGGVSPEHEVSIITGLQVIENVDSQSFRAYALYVSPSGEFFYLPNINTRGDFLHSRRIPIAFGCDTKGGFFTSLGILKEKVYVDCAYLAFHGGNGESGQLQGLFESCNIPHTGQNVFTSAVSMNKQVTKDLVSTHGVSVIKGLSVTQKQVKQQGMRVVELISKKLKFPVIVKPVHLGSSIGVTICKTEPSLLKGLLAASQIDGEILVEELMENFVEYNCAVRRINGSIEVSEIEKPNRKDEILSFADKYEKGGGKKTGGMASLVRELPAKISKALKDEINTAAIKTYEALRATGMLRCDFLYCNNKLYLVEVNPIPGSMSYYLWEASGISFTDQITQSIAEAISESASLDKLRLTYKTDIVKIFVNSTSR